MKLLIMGVLLGFIGCSSQNISGNFLQCRELCKDGNVTSYYDRQNDINCQCIKEPLPAYGGTRLLYANDGQTYTLTKEQVEILKEAKK